MLSADTALIWSCGDILAAFCARPQTTAMVDIFTWGLLVPMLEANPDPVKVAHARELFYNFFSYNTVRARALWARALVHGARTLAHSASTAFEVLRCARCGASSSHRRAGVSGVEQTVDQQPAH